MRSQNYLLWGGGSMAAVAGDSMAAVAEPGRGKEEKEG